MAHFPGFDVGSYPGDYEMTAWAQAGVYKWCGYYLTSPCHSDTSFTPFTGKARFLHSLGFGLAILYVGHQQGGCGGKQLTNDLGCLHGADAVSKCKAEGFPANAIIFLDVEYFDGSISSDFSAYFQGWLSAVLQSQLYQPGVYCAKVNFSDVYNAAQREYAAQGASGGPAVWIALEDVLFDPVSAAPTDCGIAQANLWQGLLDTQEEQGGVSLDVDLDSADSTDPSCSRPCLTLIEIDVTSIEIEED